MNKLALLFHSEVRAAVLALLFGLRPARMYRAEIIGKMDFAQRSVEEELEKLTTLGLIETAKDGNRRYYSPNRAHPWYPELLALVLKSAGLGDVLRGALGSDKIDIAFVFGSLAALTESADSDVDLMVIGRMGLRDLAPRLRGVTEKIGREINAHTFSREEFNSALCGRLRTGTSTGAFPHHDGRAVRGFSRQSGKAEAFLDLAGPFRFDSLRSSTPNERANPLLRTKTVEYTKQN